MREAVRSGRRTNFFITENRFIDHYAAKVGGSGVAVYSILQRCANSETRETWISAQKMADVLAMDKSTVYRHLKQLEDLQLIKTLRTREKTIYIVLPVPSPRPEAGPTPLFDSVEHEKQDHDSSWPPVAAARTGRIEAIDSYECDQTFAPTQRHLASARPAVAHLQTAGSADAKRNKEEQDTINKTQEQDLFDKSPPEIAEAAQRILTILSLPDSSMSAAIAAVELKRRQTRLSSDGVVQEIVTAANYAERRGVDKKDFLDDFLAHAAAQQILKNVGQPVTNSLIAVVTAAVKAEVTYTGGLPVEKVAELITKAAIEDGRRGVVVDRFYFENVKWRSHGVTKAERRTLDNLEVNAKVKQRLRERLGGAH